MKRIIATVLTVCLLAGSLAGCVIRPVEELYSLPKQSENYYNLREAIRTVMGSGVDYSGPVSGANQQAVQLTDLDGDGEDEVVLFAVAADSAPLKLYIFDKINGEFKNIAVIEGEGSSFESVQYLQIDGKPGLEIIVGRQLSDKIAHSLSVYSLAEGTLSELLTTNYSEYTAIDMDMDGLQDILILRADSEERTGVAELYRFSKGFLQRENEVLLSGEMASVKRIITGNMCRNVPAAFVASAYDDSSIVTDIITLRDGKLVNLNLPDVPNTNTATLRNYYVYSTDIDRDGLIELPSTQRLLAIKGEEGSQDQWVINWFNMNLDGTRIEKTTTYHCYDSGWYVALSESWVPNLIVSRKQSDSTYDIYDFSLRLSGETKMLFRIYGVSSSERANFDKHSEAIFLTEKGSTSFFAVLGAGADAVGLTENGMRELFHLIRVDWNTGEV